MIVITEGDLKAIGTAAIQSKDPKERAMALLRAMKARSGSHFHTVGFKEIADLVKSLRATADALDLVMFDELGMSATVFMNRDLARVAEFYVTTDGRNAAASTDGCLGPQCGFYGSDRASEWYEALPERHREAVDCGELLPAMNAYTFKTRIEGRAPGKAIRDLTNEEVEALAAEGDRASWPIASVTSTTT